MAKRKPKSGYLDSTREWAQSFGFCWRCRKRGAWALTLEIHHFCQGSNRERDNLATTAIACPDCHGKEHRGDSIGLLGWLWLKRLLDRKHFDLTEVCRVRGRAPGAITLAEIDQQRPLLEQAGVKFQ